MVGKTPVPVLIEKQSQPMAVLTTKGDMLQRALFALPDGLS